MFNTPSDLLCSSCDLCCQVAYGLAPLENDDVLIFGGNAMILPCTYSRGGCLAYSRRPKICCEYICALFIRLQRGEIGLIDGRRIVLEAKTLVTSLEILLAPSVPGPMKMVNGLIVELLNSRGKTAGDLIQEYEDGKYKDSVPAQALSKIDELHSLLITYFYHGADLVVKE